MSAIDRKETMWATMVPDVYGGETCDKIVPRWDTYAAGDKDGAFIHEPLQLDPRTFPPGTKIVISEPVCPTCDEPREPRPHDDGVHLSHASFGITWSTNRRMVRSSSWRVSMLP